MSGNQAYLYPVTLNATTPHIVSAAPFLPIYRAYKKSKRHYHHLLSNLCSPSAPPPSPGSAVGILQIYGFRVYIANILLLLLLLTVSQVRCASAPVYSHQLIKFELLTQSIRQPSCQNIYMEDSVPLFSISVCLYYTIPPRVRQSDSARFFRIWRLTVTVHSVPPRGVFMRILHENPETAHPTMNATVPISFSFSPRRFTSREPSRSSRA